MAGPMLFALAASHGLGQRVAQALGEPLAPHEERQFEDGEHKSRPLESVRGRDVYVLQSLHGKGGQSVDGTLLRLLFFIGALRQSGAGRIAALVPYLGYSRKDRRTQPNDPVTTRYVAALFEAVATDRIVTVDVHNLAAYQNAFRCQSEQLEARHLLVGPVAAELGDEEAVVLSPDVGGSKRAERFRERLEQRLGRPLGSGFMEKRRRGGLVSGEMVVGEVAGRTVLLVDDLIAAGTTLARAASACRQAGAGRILAAATHGLFAADAGARLSEAALARIWVTDSVPQERSAAELPGVALEVVGLAPFLAEAVRRLHRDESLADMSETYGR